MPIELVWCVVRGDLKPCPSDAGGFTTASVMSWQRAEGGEGMEGGTTTHEGKVSQYYGFFFFFADKGK